MSTSFPDLNQIFAPLDGLKKLALAVSGGGDSMALMHMMADWRKGQGLGAPQIFVLTVNHGLRPQALSEVEFVSIEAQRLGFEAHILTIAGLEAGANLQARGREARYQLMSEFMRSQDIQALVTAHNLDDQAETFLMRLARGSGVDGLAAMALRTPLYGIEIYRPLLDVSRGALREWLVSVGGEWVEDPSNENEAFERVRVRKLLSELNEGDGAFSAHISQSAHRLRRVRAVLERLTQEWCSTNLKVEPTGVIGFSRHAFLSLDKELQLRVLSHVVSICGGGQGFRYKRLEQAITHIVAMGAQKYAFGGAIIDGRDESQFEIYREVKRGGLETIEVSSGSDIIWDGRVLVQFDEGCDGDVQLRALSENELVLIKQHYNDELGRQFPLLDEVAVGLLVVTLDGEIVAVPQFDVSEQVPVLAALGVKSDKYRDVLCHFPTKLVI